MGRLALRLEATPGGAHLKTKVAEDPLARDEIVAALSGRPDGRGDHDLSLSERLDRLVRHLDRRDAVECAQVLGDCVFQERPKLAELEALVMLGLAHPRVFRKFGLSISSEGRRLALMLENSDRTEEARELLELLAQRLPEDREVQQDLASLMRRTGGVEEFIERCIHRAEAQAKAGNYMDAVSALQEVLLHDQGRRDVARMIRDLRYEEQEVRQRSKRRSRGVLYFLGLALLIAAVGIRELSIRHAYAGIPEAPADDRESLRARLAAVDACLGEHLFWFGYFAAVDERSRLQRQIDGLEARIAEKQREAIRLLEQRVGMAEGARVRGLQAVARGEMKEALQQFRTALELCTDDWSHRERVRSDVIAIETWLEGRRN